MVTKPKVEATITKKKDAQGRTVGATGSYIAKDVIPKTEDRIERKVQSEMGAVVKKKDAQGRTVGATGSYIAKDVIPKTEDRIERKETIRLLPIKKKKIVYRGNPGSGKADAVEVDD